MNYIIFGDNAGPLGKCFTFSLVMAVLSTPLQFSGVSVVYHFFQCTTLTVPILSRQLHHESFISGEVFVSQNVFLLKLISLFIELDLPYRI